MNVTRVNGDRSFFPFLFSLRNRIIASPFVSPREFSHLFLRAENKFLLARTRTTSQASLSIDAAYFSFVATGGSYFRINANEKKKARRAFLPAPSLSPWRRFQRRHRLTNRSDRSMFDEIAYPSAVKRKSNHGRPINKSVGPAKQRTG